MPSKKASPIKVFAKAIGHYPGLTLCLILVIVLDVAAALAPPLLLGKIGDSLTTTSAQLLLYSGLAYFASLLLTKLLEAVREGMITVWGEKLIHEIHSQMACQIKKTATPKRGAAVWYHVLSTMLILWKTFFHLASST